MSGAAHAYSVGLIGAGRLGQAFGRSAHIVNGQTLSVWSRRFGSPQGAMRAERPGLGLDVRGLDEVLSNPMVVCAAPNAALRDVAVANERLFDEFAGLIILTGADSPDAQLHARLAAAVTVRVVPILLPGDDRILCLALAPRKGGARWAQAKAWLDTLGEVVVVEDPQIYREIMVLTSPLAAVLRTALTSALSRFLDQRPGGAALQHQGFDAASLALTGRTGSLGPASTRHDARIATPGGLTEAGLQHADVLSDALLTAIASMRRRADALDRPQIEPGDGHGPR